MSYVLRTTGRVVSRNFVSGERSSYGARLCVRRSGKIGGSRMNGVEYERLKWCDDPTAHDPHEWHAQYGMVVIKHDCPGEDREWETDAMRDGPYA